MGFLRGVPLPLRSNAPDHRGLHFGVQQESCRCSHAAVEASSHAASVRSIHTCTVPPYGGLRRYGENIEPTAVVLSSFGLTLYCTADLAASMTKGATWARQGRRPHSVISFQDACCAWRSLRRTLVLPPASKKRLGAETRTAQWNGHTRPPGTPYHDYRGIKNATDRFQPATMTRIASKSRVCGKYVQEL